MYRVLDTRKVFQVLREHNFGQDCRLKLSIRDSFLPENDGSTIVHFEGGKPHLKKDDDFEVEVRLNVSDFSSLLMGTVRFRRLHRYGLADISDPSYVDTVKPSLALRKSRSARRSSNALLPTGSPAYHGSFRPHTQAQTRLAGPWVFHFHVP